MKTLVVIPARSGSKGLPHKNVKLLAGKPLMHYSIEVAQQVFTNADICITTDSEEYALVAEKTGVKVPFVRSKKLSSDTATSQDVILDCVQFYESKGLAYETVLLLQPTSPFRKKEHLKEILSKYDKNHDMVVSVKETTANPYYVLAEENDKGFLEKSKKGRFTRRQDCPKVWEYNGSMYLINVKSLQNKKMSEFTKVKKYEMDEYYSLDIDTQFDFDFAEFCLNKKEYLNK